MHTSSHCIGYREATMDDAKSPAIKAQDLRAQASRFRQLAQDYSKASSLQIAEKLLQVAVEVEAKAALIEANAKPPL